MLNELSDSLWGVGRLEGPSLPWGTEGLLLSPPPLQQLAAGRGWGWPFSGAFSGHLWGSPGPAPPLGLRGRQGRGQASQSRAGARPEQVGRAGGGGGAALAWPLGPEH